MSTREFEQLRDAVINRDQTESATSTFAGDVVIQEGAEPGRIQVRRFGEVDDCEFLRAAHENLLKVKQVRESYGAMKMKDACLCRTARNHFEGQRFVIHSNRDCKKRAARFDDSPVNTTVNRPWTI